MDLKEGDDGIVKEVDHDCGSSERNSVKVKSGNWESAEVQMGTYC